MTQERRREEELSLLFTPVPLAVLSNDGNQRLLHSLRNRKGTWFKSHKMGISL